jgi:hypothetical protein
MGEKIPVSLSLSPEFLEKIEALRDKVGFSRSIIIQMAAEAGLERVRSNLSRARPNPAGISQPTAEPQASETVTS